VKKHFHELVKKVKEAGATVYHLNQDEYTFSVDHYGRWTNYQDELGDDIERMFEEYPMFKYESNDYGKGEVSIDAESRFIVELVMGDDDCYKDKFTGGFVSKEYKKDFNKSDLFQKIMKQKTGHEDIELLLSRKMIVRVETNDNRLISLLRGIEKIVWGKEDLYAK